MCVSAQEHGGEVWAYQEPVAVFLGEQLLGGVAELLGWASEHYGYQDSRCVFACQCVCVLVRGPLCLLQSSL